MIIKGLLSAFFFVSAVVGLPAAADSGAVASAEETETALVVRTKALLRSFDDKRDKAENEAYRARAVALADTLEAADELVLASHCLERAGMISYYAGEMDAAAALWERGAAIARRSGDPKRIGALLNAQAVGVSAAGDDAAALALQWELLALRRENADLRGEGSTWHNIAYSQLALFQYPEAVESLRRAIRIHREVGNIHGLAASYLSLAPRLVAYVRFEEALAVADSAVAAATAVDNPQFLGTALNARGEMLHRRQRDAEALADLDRAIAVLEKAGADRFVGVARSNRADVLVSLDRLDEALAEADRAAVPLAAYGDPSYPLINRAVVGRAHLRAEDFAAARDILGATLTEFRALQDSLPDPVSRANANHAGGSVSYLALAHSRQGRLAEAWSVVEEGSARVLRADLAAPAAGVTLAEFQAALAAREAAALVYGLATVEGCPAFVVTGRDIHGFEFEVGNDVLLAHADVIADLAAGREGPRLDERLARLGEVLVEPALDHLPAGIVRIIVVPGSFAGLPFEALPTVAGGFLGDRLGLAYAPSATAFVELESRNRVGRGFLALADPLAAQPAEGTVWAERLRSAGSAPLPEARVEVANIAPAGGSVFVGGQATVAAFRSLAPGAAIVHLATHAIVDPANPDASALVLKAADGGEPLLLAREIGRLELGADLICLSSCGTAGGYQVPGEGTFGLTRAFLVAGARTVVSSWWDVEDRAGRRFMELFYEGLREGRERDLAAQRARMRMSEEGFSRRDRLAFAVVGAVSGPLTDVLEPDHGGTRSWLLTLAGAFVLGAGLWWANARRPH